MAAGSSDGPSASLRRSLPLGLALLIAFSPVLIDLGRHIVATPWARGALVFPWLVFLAARADRPDRPPASGRRWVALALGAALVFQLLAIGGDAIRIARVGVAAAVAIGLWGSGLAGPRTALLALWLLPVPSFAVEALSPGLETAKGRLAALWPGLGMSDPVGLSAPALVTGQGAIALTPLEGGVVLAAGLAGLLWARALLRGGSLGRCSAGAVIGAVMAIPLQIVVLVALGQGVSSGWLPLDLARPMLDLAGPLLVVAGGLGLTLLRPVHGGRTERPAARRRSVPC